MDILIPRRVASDIEGYKSLISLYYHIKHSSDSYVILDFRDNTWFEANLCAVLGAMLFSLEKEDGKNIGHKNLGGKLLDVLERNGYFPSNRWKNDPRIETVIAYKFFEPLDDDKFIRYIKNELLAKKDFPKHTTRLGKMINENIYELFENARTHGRCAYVYTCGQYFPNKDSRRLDITIVDMGNTIRGNVVQFLNVDISGKDAIDWALIQGNTTKVGDIPGGLGLFRIIDFIKLNQGKIHVISADGYWEYKHEKIVKIDLPQTFPGTIVNLEFNLDDDNVYYLDGESVDDIKF